MSKWRRWFCELCGSKVLNSEIVQHINKRHPTAPHNFHNYVDYFKRKVTDWELPK